MLRQRSVVIPLSALALLVAAACGDPDPGPPGVLEIGIHDEATGDFIPMTDDMSVPVVLGANGLNMIVPSLRAIDIDPRAPDPTVTVSVGGILMAADIEGETVDMQDSANGYVLWDLRVPFQTDLCCYNCVEGIVFATLEEQSGRIFEGEVRILLSRNGTCPDESVCCGDVNACPDPALTQVCQ